MSEREPSEARARGEKGVKRMANPAAKYINRAEVWVEPQLKRRIDHWPDKPNGMRAALKLYDRLLRFPVLLSHVEFELASREEQARPAMNGQHHQPAE
jgi:hypothetical protein